MVRISVYSTLFYIRFLGVMWKLNNDADQYVLVVNYFKANFSTAIQYGVN
jgi:hypothetical protein